MGLILLGLFAAAAVAVAISERWPPGQAPHDVLPGAWAELDSAGVDPVLGSSGMRYEVESWAPNSANETFHVARTTPGQSYVAYVHDRSTGKRRLFRAYSHAGSDEAAALELAIMQRDFGV